MKLQFQVKNVLICLNLINLIITPMKSHPFLRTFVVLSFLLFWFAIILQFVLVLRAHKYDWFSALDGFFMYFTVLTNIMAGLCFGWLLFSPHSKVGGFFSKASVITAITIYIIIVAVVYNTLLRGIVELNRYDSLANELLHVINPVVFLFFWIFFVDKKQLMYKQSLSWLLYPFLYMVFALVRGYFTGTYPYPFINAAKLGYSTTALNCVFLFFGFLLLSLFFIWISKLTSDSEKVEG